MEEKEINPDVKVIISSGYNQEITDTRFYHENLVGFIQKPFEINMLINMVKDELDKD